MILTTADVAENAAKDYKQKMDRAVQNTGALKQGSGGEDVPKTSKRRNHKRSASASLVFNNDGSDKERDMADLEIVGPDGIKDFLHSLRHFMRRDRFHVHVHEGEFISSSCSKTITGNTKAKKKAKLNKTKSGTNEEVNFNVESIPISYEVNPSSGDESNNADLSDQPPVITKQAASYLFTTPPLPGKFLIEKAIELNIPRGPLYAQLKGGKSVKFPDPTTNEERTVLPEEVLEKGSAGVGAAVIYCPNLEVLRKLRESSLLQKFTAKKQRTGTAGACIELDAIVHLTPKSVFDCDEYQSWCREFGEKVDHITLHAAHTLEDRIACGGNSPFISAVRGGIQRSHVNSELYPMLIPEDSNGDTANETVREDGLKPIKGYPMMEYVLMPRHKRGLDESVELSSYSQNDIDSLKKEVLDSGAVELGSKILSALAETETNTESGNNGELLFTGTGSAVPCKHRNVTGMYLRMNNGNSLLLDVGEGTVGQLLHLWKCYFTGDNVVDEYNSRVKGIKAVWISHPHADHHLGILRLLSERNVVCGYDDPIVLMAPPNMFAFLSEYQSVVPDIGRSYIAVDCRDMIYGKEHPMGKKLFSDLGITNCMSVPVAHCPHSFAVVIDGTSFGRVSYSGDCRPSSRFAQVGYGSDLLIHEATFEDGMEEEAFLKRHSTVGEAIDIGQQMKASTICLTHFSQRYPRIPPLKTTPTDDLPIAFAFDYMRLKPSLILLASKMTPALRLLYPEENGEEDEKMTTETSGDSIAKDLMAVPGVFAAKGVL